ncbi:MAG: ribonuclease D [Pseudomonadota bacterium]
MTPRTEWIADHHQLRDAASAWRGCIALDTEFIRTDTYYPVPGLYQIAHQGTVYLLDPLSIEDWQPFVEVLLDTSVFKIMHACQEDLELIHHHLGVVPQRIFDTQYANAFVSPDFSLSYAALVQRLLAIDLPKHATRSNWLQRPLTNEQLQYAMEDVIYLEQLFDHLREALQTAGRDSWFDDDMQLRADYQPNDPTQHYLNLKKAWQLGPQQLAVLQGLCAWREETAQTRNIPRNRVVWDDHLFEFARIKQLGESDVQRALPKGIARRYAAPLVAAHEQGRLATPPGAIDRPLSAAQGAVVKDLREVARKQSTLLNFAPELLARKRDVEACVRHYLRYEQLTDHYRSWRHDLVGAQFAEILDARLQHNGAAASG